MAARSRSAEGTTAVGGLEQAIPSAIRPRIVRTGSFTARIGALLSQMRTAWNAARRRREGIRHLHGMSSHELKDIGLCRSDLADADRIKSGR